jgi:hypothetical protein
MGDIYTFTMWRRAPEMREQSNEDIRTSYIEYDTG